MIRNLLILLYVFALLEATFELGLAVAPGVSAKNLLLYALVFTILARAVLVNTEIYIPLANIHVAFLLLVSYATISWMMHSLFDPTYPSFVAFKALKSELVDNFLFFGVFFFGPNNYADAKRIFLFSLHLIAILSLLTIVDMSALINLGIMEQDVDGRVRGPIGESNQYGAFMVFFVPLFAAMALGSKGVAQVAWWIVFLCGAMLMVSTGSRGAYLGVVIGVITGLKFILPYFDRRRLWRTASKIGAVCLVIAIAIGVQNIDLVAERFDQSTSTNLDELSSGRSAIWRATILVQAENPISFLIGNGWNAHTNSGIWKSAHNSYLLMLYELGAIGLILFAILMVTVISQVRVLVSRTSGKERVLMSGIAFGLFGLLTAITFVDLSIPWFYVWSFIGMSLRIAYEKDREYRDEQEVVAPPGAQRFA
jgi:O-antigen ligase